MVDGSETENPIHNLAVEAICETSSELCSQLKHINESDYLEINLCTFDSQYCHIENRYGINEQIQILAKNVSDSPDILWELENPEYFNACKFWPETCDVNLPNSLTEQIEGFTLESTPDTEKPDGGEYEFNICHYWPETCEKGNFQEKIIDVTVCNFNPGFCSPRMETPALKDFVESQLLQHMQAISN